MRCCGAFFSPHVLGTTETCSSHTKLRAWLAHCLIVVRHRWKSLVLCVFYGSLYSTFVFFVANRGRNTQPRDSASTTLVAVGIESV